MKQVEFNDDSFCLASDILDRYEEVIGERVDDKQSLTMDIMAADGVNGNPKLDLNGLLNTAKDFDLVHDVVGISNNMNRETGAIENCFLARCAVSEVENV